jgi:hypothetical protein
MSNVIDHVYHCEPIEVVFDDRRFNRWSYYAVPTTTEVPASGGPLHVSGDDTPAGFVDLDTDFDDAHRLLALRTHLDEWDLPMTVSKLEIVMLKKRWLVVREYEMEQCLEQVLTDHVHRALDIPEALRPYFNEDAWRADQEEIRSQWLSPYDHIETRVVLADSQTFLVYRQQ